MAGARRGGHPGGLRYTKRRTEYLLRRFVTKQAVASVTGRSHRPGCARPHRGAQCAQRRAIRCRRRRSTGFRGVDQRPGRLGGVCDMPPSDSPAVGCDLELVEPRTPGFVADFLTAAEQRLVASRPTGDERDAAANLIWSAKESALKVLRTGLRRDTRSVEVALAAPRDDGWGALTVRAVEGHGIPRLVAAGWPLSADFRRGWPRRRRSRLATRASSGPQRRGTPGWTGRYTADMPRSTASTM